MIDLKRALRHNSFSYGSWITLGHTAVPEIMAQAGFQWLTIDLEHSAIDLGTLQPLIQIIALSGCAPLVRLSSNDPTQAKRVLDAGAAGIIVPMVNSPEEAKTAVNAAYYPPRGERGVGLARAQRYGPGFEAYRKTFDKNGIVIIQIEHRKAVENIDEILETPGIDGIFLGPYDISASYGIPGQLDHPLVRLARRKVLDASARRGICAGIHVIAPSAQEVRARVKEGFRFVALSTDFLFLGESCRRSVAEIKTFAARNPTTRAAKSVKSRNRGRS